MSSRTYPVPDGLMQWAKEMKDRLEKSKSQVSLSPDTKHSTRTSLGTRVGRGDLNSVGHYSSNEGHDANTRQQSQLLRAISHWKRNKNHCFALTGNKIQMAGIQLSRHSRGWSRGLSLRLAWATRACHKFLKWELSLLLSHIICIYI